MKAIHNNKLKVPEGFEVVNEPDKNTNWKQFTTPYVIAFIGVLLSMNPIKIQIESNSQPAVWAGFATPRCQWTR